MAGAGYKLFNTGDVLTAAQVNTYLQEQVVMVFADAAARTTALSGVLAEGMLSYLKDTDAVQYYNGSSWTTINTDQTPLTTKGDLFTYSTTDARLAVGNNGETLVADSSQTTGLRYNPQNALANPMINGGMDIWQRGTSIAFGASSYQYMADRWVFVRANFTSGATVSRQTTSDTTNLPNIQYAARVQRNSGNTSTDYLELTQSLENANAVPFIGKTITISYYARAGANYSSASSALRTSIITGTGTDQSQQNFTGRTSALDADVTLTTTWQRFAHTITLSSTITQFAALFRYTPVGTAGTNDYFEVTGVQIDLGTYTASTAPTFRRSGGTLAGELAACQRYYAKSYSSTVAPATTSALGSIVFMALVAYSSNNLRTPIRFPVAMRTAPTITLYSTNSGATGKWYNEGTATDVDAVAHQIGENGFITYQSAGTSNASNVLLFHYVASAEL